MGDFARIRVYMSSHAPREGSDDVLILGGSRCIDDFNPRSPRGERPNIAWIMYESQYISIHAPREGSDDEY